MNNDRLAIDLYFNHIRETNRIMLNYMNILQIQENCLTNLLNNRNTLNENNNTSNQNNNTLNENNNTSNQNNNNTIRWNSYYPSRNSSTRTHRRFNRWLDHQYIHVHFYYLS